MKTRNLIYSIIIGFTLVSCEFSNIEEQKTSNLIFYASTSFENTDTLIFTSNDICHYNNSTHELCFNDTLIPTQLKSYAILQCRIGEDSLFEAKITSDVMSSIVNDLVLNHSLNNGKYYFEDGYPTWIDNLGATTARALNKAKRESAWMRFITALKTENKYIEK